MSVAISRRRATEDLAKHVLEAADLSWPKTIKPGDIVISGAISGAAARESVPLWVSRGRLRRREVLRAHLLQKLDQYRAATPSSEGRHS
jgi:hypothetical protein